MSFLAVTNAMSLKHGSVVASPTWWRQERSLISQIFHLQLRHYSLNSHLLSKFRTSKYISLVLLAQIILLVIPMTVSHESHNLTQTHVQELQAYMWSHTIFIKLMILSRKSYVS